MNEVLKNPDHVQTVDVSRHRKLKIKPNPGCTHAREQHVAAITMVELAECCSTFPVVLVQRPDDGRYMLAAVLGLREGENIYYGPDYWESSYIPMVIRRHPFVIGYDDRVPNGEEITTCLDTTSPFLNEQQGLALFNDNGEQSDLLKSCHQMLSRMFESQKFTDRFMQAVAALDLVAPFNLVLEQQNGTMRRVAGMFTLDEVKLQNLGAEQLRELHQNNMLHACYLIVASLHQVAQMIRLRNRRGNSQDQIVNFMFEFNTPHQA